MTTSVDFSILNGKTVMFVGGGNMARAIIDGLLNAKSGHNLDLTIVVSDKNEPKRADFAKKGVIAVSPVDAPAHLQSADVVVLAVKPQAIQDVAHDLKPYIGKALVLSVLAGVPVAVLSGLLETKAVVRSMPNLPCAIGMGATGLFAGLDIDQNNKNLCNAIMSSCGITAWVTEENNLHAVTAVAGSAPAYFFYVLECMTKTATQMGLDSEQAHSLAVQSMIGAGLLAKNADPAVLRAQVTSKGGTTAMAIAAFHDNDLPTIINKAMQACHDRSVELGKMF